MKCITTDLNGYLVEDAAVPPACPDLVVLHPGEFERFTFWADLSQYLEPGNPGVWEFYLAILLVFITAFGVKMIARTMINR